MRNKKFVVIAAALAAILGTGMAQARDRDEVQWSVTIGTPSYGQPVYSVPAYGQPVYGASVYSAPVIVQRAPVVMHPRYAQPTRWDRDGDGIPNRYDRVYNPRWDRDGDGIPNRYDRVDNRTYHGDRDGDRRDWHHDVRRDGWSR